MSRIGYGVAMVTYYVEKGRAFVWYCYKGNKIEMIHQIKVLENAGGVSQLKTTFIVGTSEMWQDGDKIISVLGDTFWNNSDELLSENAKKRNLVTR